MRPGATPPPPSTLTSASKALDFMGYDVGLLSREEADVLSRESVDTPAWQQTASAQPFTVVTTDKGDKIGFLRFPHLPSNADRPPAELVDRLSREIGKYRNEVRLVVGLSDWGWLAEQEYLSGEPANVPHILFGSGRGSGVNGRIQADGRCMWVRAYDKGRSIVEITVLEWPDRKNSFAWKPGTNYNTKSIGLNDLIKDNSAVSAILK